MNNRRVSPAAEAQMRKVLRPDELELLDKLNNLDDWPQINVSFKAKGRKGSIGRWPMVMGLPDTLTLLLMRLASGRDEAAWTQMCDAEESEDRSCSSCGGSGRYDVDGGPPCGACEGTGRQPTS